MKKTAMLAMGILLVFGYIGVAKTAQADILSTDYLLTEKFNGGYVVAKVVNYDGGDEKSILEVVCNGKKWSKTLAPYVYPIGITFTENNTAVMLTYEWLGNNTGIYYFRLNTNRSFKKWTFDEGGLAKFAILEKKLIVGVTGLDEHFNQVKRVYLIGNYTIASSTPVLLKEFLPEIVDIHFGYQQKESTYYGFAVMTVESSTYQALVYRVTDGSVENTPSGYRQLTFWSQVGSFHLIDGFGLTARISELTFD
jgi:hypothetical protein